MRRSQQLSLTAVFAALHAVLYLVSFDLTPWRNWGIYLEAIEGIVLGPEIGFSAALLGSSVARMIRPDALWMFGIVAEPLSAMMAGLLARARWKPVLAVYAAMLSAYFIHPFGRALPIWTILDILFALLLIYPAAKLGQNLFKSDFKRLPIVASLVTFVCVVTDSLVRVFLLIPCGLYSLFTFSDSYDKLYWIFVSAATYSYIEDAIAIVASFVVIVPLLAGIWRLKLFEKRDNH
jgi:uncharacterized membrane protein